MRDTASAPTATGAAAPASPDRLPGVDLPTLTGLRVFAALAVVVCHLRPLSYSMVPASSVATPLFDAGTLGVDVFFVLSGFIIAHTYAHRLAAPAAGAVRDYLVARLARVYPLHLTTFSIMVVLFLLSVAGGFDVNAPVYSDVQHTPLSFIGNVLMLQALPGIPAWNFPAWSISCEIAAYLIFPLFAARLLRMRWLTAATLSVVALGLQLFLIYELRSFDYTALVWPRIAGGFTAGAALWVVWRRVLRPGRWADVAVVMCVLCAVLLVWHREFFLLAIPLLSVMVPAAACATGPVGRLLAHPVTQWGGRISYGLYLAHIPVMTVLILWVVPTDVYVHPSMSRAALVLGGIVVASVAVAAFLHHCVEEPARRWVRRRFARTSAPAMVATGAGVQ